MHNKVGYIELHIILLFDYVFAMTGGKEVDEEDDMFILVAPQNAVGNCIIDVRS
jgi:hypothetical protein